MFAFPAETQEVQTIGATIRECREKTSKNARDFPRVFDTVPSQLTDQLATPAMRVNQATIIIIAMVTAASRMLRLRAK